MPARPSFTSLCMAASRSRFAGRADLHVHTTYSDGSYTPAQVIDLARRSGLAAVAITDHDTLAGIEPARASAGSALEVVPGVEISAEYQARELHLLGYFIDSRNQPLLTALERLSRHRTDRFWSMVERLRGTGVSLDEEELRTQAATGVLGRRHLAMLLVKAGRVSNVQEAFGRYLGDGGRVCIPKLRLPVEEAIALVRGAGGVASWAHPSAYCTREHLIELRTLGLDAVEVKYPGVRLGRQRELCGWLSELKLAITGGSDCHGPEPARRSVGACSISAQELEDLRRLARKE